MWHSFQAHKHHQANEWKKNTNTHIIHWTTLCFTCVCTVPFSFATHSLFSGHEFIVHARKKMWPHVKTVLYIVSDDNNVNIDRFRWVFMITSKLDGFKKINQLMIQNGSWTFDSIVFFLVSFNLNIWITFHVWCYCLLCCLILIWNFHKIALTLQTFQWIHIQ